MWRMHLLVRAVIFNDRRVLLAHQVGADNTFLPGGHVEAGEPAVHALHRELREETGLDVDVGRYLGVVEARWKDDTEQHHEIAHVFLTSFVDRKPPDAVESRERHLEFFWVPLGRLQEHMLLPRPVVGLIRRLAAGDDSARWASTAADL